MPKARALSSLVRALTCVLLLFGFAGVIRAAEYSDARPAHAAAEPQNWLTYNGNYDEQRFSPLDQIDAGNVGRLKLAWSADLDSTRGLEGTPLVVDGTMYVTTAWSKMVALDAATGAVKWRYDPRVPGRTGINACCDVVNRGAAYDAGKLFFGTIDGRLIALDAASGKPIWSTQTTDPDKPYTITGAPRVVRGKVIIGNGGAEYAVRGFVSAYDEATGKLVWRFYTVPGDPAKRDGTASDAVLEMLARPTWFGRDYYRYGGGGTVWDSIVYDADLNRLYIGVGNGGPWSRAIRSEDKGDNLFLGSIVALDPDTGRYLWHYQETPGDTWDFTSSQQITLAELPTDGVRRKVILHAPKNGFFYVIDRQTGKPLSAEKFVPVNWAERIDLATGRPVENPDARFRDKPFVATSGALGAHNWHPMAFSPRTGLVYIPAQQVPFLYKRDTSFAWRPHMLNVGVDLAAAPAPESQADIDALRPALQGRLIAWDPVHQREAWRVEHASSGNGGVLATAGNLVFQGLSDATFRAYRADTGAEVWRFAAQTPILPGAISYSVEGIQYIAVAAGYGSGYALGFPAMDGARKLPPGRLLAFRLDGKASLPPVEGTLANANPARDAFSPAQLADGAQLFARNCSMCHGTGAHSAGVVPDLRRSAILPVAQAWRAIVIDGVLQSRGMISFRDYLTPAQAEAIRGYVSAQATRLEACQKQSRAACR